MCSFNTRNYKQCQSDPKHNFKEVVKCVEMRDRQNNEACLQQNWNDLGNVAKTTTTIVCPFCNDIMYILQGEGGDSELEETSSLDI
jgi:hypothetical protein